LQCRYTIYRHYQCNHYHERTKWNAAYDKANDALPKTGGTLTGSLDIYGNASQNPLRTRLAGV